MKLPALMCLVLLFIFTLASASDFSVHSMLVGEKIFELKEERQLTFPEDGRVVRAFVSPSGKQIAYITEEEAGYRLRTIRPSGGRSSVVIDGAVSAEKKKKDGQWWELYPVDADITQEIWSPDGSMLAFPAVKYAFIPNDPQESGDATAESWILVMTPSGADRGSVKLDGFDLMKGPFWHPNGRSFAIYGRTPQDQTLHLVVYEPGNRSFKTLLSTDTMIYPVGWSENGKTFLYKNPNKPKHKMELHEVSWDGTNDRVIDEDYKAPYDSSPDGRFYSDNPHNSDDGIHIVNNLTQENTLLVKEPKARFIGWSPNGKMLVYCLPQEVKDSESKRELVLNTLWLSSIKGGQFGRMCVSSNVNYDPAFDRRPSWSSDASSMAYISHERLHFVRFSWKDPNPVEKKETGLPLSENDEKTLVMDQAKQLGVAFMMYAGDYDDCLPTGDNLQDVLSPFMKHKDLMFRPGTQQNIFSYRSGYSFMGSIEKPAETALGTMDAGYGWTVVLYADGHVQVVPK